MPKNKFNQTHYGTGDNISGDKIIQVIKVFSFLGLKMLKYLDSGLMNRSQSILEALKTKIIIEKHNNYDQILNSDNQLFLISGKAGVGKSFYVKNFIEKYNNIDYFIFRGSEFNIDNINLLFNSYGGFTLSDFKKIIKKKKHQVFLIIDSAEQLLDIRDTQSLHDFLYLVLKLNIKIIFTCRDQYIGNLNSLLGTLNKHLHSSDIISLDLLKNDEINYILKSNNLLLPKDSNLLSLLSIPFYLNLFVECSIDKSTSYTDFREKVFDYKLGSDYQIRDTFEKLTLERVTNLNYFIKGEGLKKENLDFLKAKGVIAQDKDKGYFITYDIYEEWGLEKFIEKKYNEESDIISFFNALGRELPMRRAFRKWLKEKLLISESSMKDILEKSITNGKVKEFWKDEIIVSAVGSIYGVKFLNFWKKSLLKDENILLEKVMLLTLVTGKTTNYEILSQLSRKIDYPKNATMFLKADGIIWNNMIDFIYENKEKVKLSRVLLNVLKEYTNTYKKGESAKKSGLTSIYYLEKIEKNRLEHKIRSSRYNNTAEVLSKSILSVSSEIYHDIEVLLDNYLNYQLDDEHRIKKSVYFGEPPIQCDDIKMKPYFTLVNIILTSLLDSVQPSIYLPSKILEIFDYSVYCKSLNGDHRGGLDIGSYFGINDKSEYAYYPPSSYQTPFYWLLKNNKTETIDFIINFNNKVTKKYVKSGLDGTIKTIVLTINGTKYTQYSDMRLYGLYRGYLPVPDSLSSMHMALEKYLLEYAKECTDEDLSDICKKLLKDSISISTTAIVMSVAIAFPHKLKDILLILLKTKEIFLYDLNRSVSDMQIQLQYGIGYGIDSKNDFHYNERIETCKEKHRTFKFEDIIRLLQLDSTNEKVIKEINVIFDKHKEDCGTSEEYKYILNRTDLREVDVEEKETDENKVMITFNPKNEEIARESNASLKSINDKSKYLGLSNYLQKKLSQPEFQDDRYKDFLSALKEFKLFLKDKNLEEESYMYKKLHISIAYIGIRDYYNQLTKKDVSLFLEIILEKGNTILKESSDRNYSPEVGDELIFYSLILMLEKAPSNGAIKKLILEILVNGNYNYINNFILSNKLKFSPENIFNVLLKIDSGLFESVFLGFIFIRYKREVVEKKREKVNGEYTFNLSTKDILKEYDNYINNLLVGDYIEYKEYIYKNFSKIDDFILVYGFKMLANGDNNYLDYIEKLSDKIFSMSFDRDSKIEHTIVRDFLDKYTSYLLLLPNTSDIDYIISPFLNHVNLKTDTAKDLLASLLFTQDASGKNTNKNFWYLWENKFFDKFVLLLNDDKYNYFEKELIINYLFAWTYWNDNAKEWHSMDEVNSDFFTNFASQVPNNKYVLYSITHLLDSVGSKAFFNNGIDWINDIIINEKNILESFDDDETTYSSNLLYFLENYIRRYLFIKNQDVRYNKQLKNKLLKILDFMVINGSSTAYLLRDNI